MLLALLGAEFEGFPPQEGPLLAILEFLAIVSVGALVFCGRLRNLHQRWLDFRLLAERLRHYAFLAPIGGVSAIAQPIFHTHDDYSHALIGWLVCRISRAEGIPAVSFCADYRKAYQGYLLDMLNGQVGYHQTNSLRNHRIAHILHSLNTLLLFAILAACAAHIVWHETLTAAFKRDLTLFAACLPALGAAIAGILSQGEFARIANRSEGMEEHLRDIADTLDKHTDATVLELAQQAQSAIDTMSQELFDWRVIFRAKPLEQHA